MTAPRAVRRAGTRVVDWVRGTRADQERYLRVINQTGALSSVGLLVAVPNLVAAWWVGWLLVALVVQAFVTIAVSEAVARRSRRPELATTVGFILLLINCATAVHVSGGAASPLLALAAVPVFCQGVCLRMPVLITSTGGALVIVSGAALTGPALPAERVPPGWLVVFTFAVLLVVLTTAARALVAAETDARREAATDPLTGLPNRAAMHLRWAELIPEGEPVGVILCDVDHFKLVNDLHGHDVGDKVLIALAARLSASLRGQDTAVRLGGEELLVLLPGATGADALAAAERIRHGVSDTPLAGLAITLSAGVTVAEPDETELSAVLRRADVALYRAKAEGRNRVVAADGNTLSVG